MIFAYSLMRASRNVMGSRTSIVSLAPWVRLGAIRGMGLARRWVVDDLALKDDCDFVSELLVADTHDTEATRIVDICAHPTVSLKRENVIRLRDWLTEWLNASS